MYLICAIYDIIIENRETKEQDGNEVYMTEQDYFTGMKKNKKILGVNDTFNMIYGRRTVELSKLSREILLFLRHIYCKI